MISLRAASGPSQPKILTHLPGFQILVVLKEVGNGLQAQRIQVFGLLPLAVDRQDLVNWYRQHLAVFARFVLHLQDADGAARHHHTGNQRHGGDHQHVDRVTVTAEMVLGT
jgi:hypothetical protein